MGGPRRGRVVARDGDRVWVRSQAEDGWWSPPGVAQPGDLIERGDDGAPPRVVASGRAAAGEVARLSRRRMDALIARGRVLAALRAELAGWGFLEIEAPVVVRAPALEVHVEARALRDGGFLATSPEYQLKRLLAGGFDRIYALGRVGRAGEEGVHHQPEFSLLEWYRGFASVDEVIADTEALVAAAARAVAGSPVVVRDGRRLELAPPWPRATVAELFERHVGVALDGGLPAAELAVRLRAAEVEVGSLAEWDDLFFAAFTSRIEPALAELDHPTVVTDWPVELGALARRKPHDPTRVERFEVYAGGLELCNGFGELTDPVEQRTRFAADQAGRAARGKPVHPIDERLLEALADGLPPSAGNALGVDRLVMLVTGARTIAEVVAFTADEL